MNIESLCVTSFMLLEADVSANEKPSVAVVIRTPVATELK